MTTSGTHENEDVELKGVAGSVIYPIARRYALMKRFLIKPALSLLLGGLSQSSRNSAAKLGPKRTERSTHDEMIDF